MYRELAEKHLQVSNVMVLKESLWETAREIARNEYDYVIDFHLNVRSRILKQLLPESVKILRYRKKSIKRTLSVFLRRDLYGGERVPEQYLKTLAVLEVSNDGKGLDFYIPERDQIYKKDLPMTHGAGYAVLALGATYYTKKLPLEKWEEICRKLEVPIILIGGKAEIEFGKKLASTDNIKILNKCGQYSIGQSASVMSQSLFVITHDSGMMHIAAALKKKVISVWGGTVPYLGFSPYVTDEALSRIVEVKNLSCRPCSKYGRNDCPKGHFKCMNDMDTEEVVRAVKN